MKIGVVGAGIAGLTAAGVLAAAGHEVEVFDKGGKPGGRLATRRADGFIFNHGCQFFTARDAQFSTATTPHAAAWPAAGDQRQVFTPNMNAYAASLAVGLTVRQNTQIAAITHGADGWRLTMQASAAAGPYETLILAIPAPQAAALLGTHDFDGRLHKVEMAPCWALLLGFEGPADGLDVLKPAGPLAWIARENARPEYPARPVAYTCHASPDWSRAHLEDAPQTVAPALLAAFTQATGLSAPKFIRAHRWRYALTETPLGAPYLWDAPRNLGLCGDWCLGGRLEAAYLSGRALGISLTA